MLYKLAQYVIRFIFFFIFRIRTYDISEINSYSGRLIVCCNHISALDPVVLGISVKPQIFFMGKKELFGNKFLSWLFKKLGAFPVDRMGVTLSALRSSLDVLKNDKILGIFPEGTRVDGFDENNAKPGIAMIAGRSGAKILPVYISGQYRFMGRIELRFGKPKDYFEGYTGKLNTEIYTEVSRQILEDIYSLGEVR